MAPTEEPKWVILILLADALGIFWLVSILIRCHRPNRSTTTQQPPSKTSISAIGFTLFILGLLAGVLYARNTGIALNRLSFWISGGLVLLSSAHLARQTSGTRALLRGALCAALLTSADFWFHFFTSFKDPTYNKFVYFSSIGHFNFTADVLVILLPLCFGSLLWDPNRYVKILSGVTSLSLALMLIMTGSLGGMGGILGGGILALGLKLISQRKASFNKTPWVRAGLLGILLALSFPWLMDRTPPEIRSLLFHRAQWEEAPDFDTHPEGERMPPLKDFWIWIHPYLGSRTPMWASTAGMIADRPWSGFGTGSYLFEYPAYQKRYDLFRDFETHGNHIKTNPHNVFLQIAAENGLPMAFLFTGLYLSLLIRCIQKALSEPDALWFCGIWLLGAAGLDALVNHVFFNPASLATVSLAIGLLHGRLSQSPKHAEPEKTTCLKSLMLIGPVIGILYLSSFPIRWVISEHFANEGRLFLENKSAPGQFQAEQAYRKAIDWFPDNAQALLGLSGVLIRQKRYLDAEPIVNQLLAISPYQTQGLLTRARIEGELGQLDQAEQTLEQALALEPDSSFFKETLERLRGFKKNLPPR